MSPQHFKSEVLGTKFLNGDHGKSHENADNFSGSNGNDGGSRIIGSGRDKDGGRSRDKCGDTPKDCAMYDIPDNNPRVHYTGPWVSQAAQFSTTHSTVGEGSTVSLRFNGSAIVVFGTIPASNESEPPTAAYIIDNLLPTIATLPVATVDMLNQALYASSKLSPNEEHLLLINVTQTQPDAPYALAGFSISLSALDFNSTSSQSQGTPTATPSASSTTVPDHKTLTIVAGVLGSLVFLFIVGIVVFLFLRWRMNARRQLSERLRSDNSSKPETVYTTFTTSESILRNDPSIWDLTPSEHNSFNEVSSRVPRPSEFLSPSDIVRPSEARLSAMEFALPSSQKSLSSSASTLEKLT